MRHIIAILLLLLVVAAPAEARPIALNHFVDVEATAAPRSVTAGGVTVTVGDRRSDPDGQPRVTVAAAGRTPLSFRWQDGGAAFSFRIAIGALARGEAPSVIVTALSGGAHCCTRVLVIQPAAHGFRRVSMGSWDGSWDDVPIDRSGDGIADFVFDDDNFLYAFGSYATSVSPLRVFNIRNGVARDVSAERAMRPIFAADLTHRRASCFGAARRGLDAAMAAEARNAACAVFAADAVRLGTFATWWPRILKAYGRAADFGPKGCHVPVTADQPCPDGQEIEYPDYPTALRAFLRAGGYPVAAP